MGKRILLADDSVTIHKVVELTFLDEDYSVEAVNNGDEAIARLDGGAPDLVIADVHMPPGASGYEVCEQVRQKHPGVPVLLLAGAFEAFDEERAAVADAYLKKPFDSQKLLQTVQELMARSEEAAAEPAEIAPEVDSADTGGADVGASETGGAETGRAEPGAAAGASTAAAAGQEAAADLEEPSETAAEAAAADATGGQTAGADSLSPAEIDAIARRVVELLGDDVLREVAWEVVPDLAEVVVKDRLRELEEAAE